MRYGVTGNGILEEAEGMEAFRNQDWKGSVIICPGGGYQWLSPREGEPVAKAFAALGWKPWILYYSVAGPGEAVSYTHLDVYKRQGRTPVSVTADMDEYAGIFLSASDGRTSEGDDV